MTPNRLLFLDSYTDPTFRSISSAEIGFGIACANAVKSGLRRLSLPLVECSPAITPDISKLDWIYSCYRHLHTAAPVATDMVFVFNSLIHFPGEIRRLVNHHTRTGCPIIGYTHGSHWDSTDTIRKASSPKLMFQDLANLLTYDRLLLVSEYYRNLLRQQLASLGPIVRNRFDEIARVVGLPIDTDTIDTFAKHSRRLAQDKPIAIVFNHALREPKRPQFALSVIERILGVHDNCTVHITRAFPPDAALKFLYNRLVERFGMRIQCHNTLSLEQYYRLLWECDIQFSTATHESFGVATVEAMYTGNACFTPRQLSYPEITGGIGTYKDDEELVQLIEMAIARSEFRSEIGSAQRAVAAKFRPGPIAEKLSAVICEL